MYHMKAAVYSVICFLLLFTTPLTSEAQLLWTVGIDDNANPVNLTGGGANAAFVQENGSINPLPGSPNNVPTVPATQSADNDYYLSGSYFTTIASVIAMYGDY